MPIDFEKEQCLSLAKAARRLPALRGDKPPHPMTLYRWATTGLKARSGRRVKLETEMVGGTRVTSLEALSRFFERLDDVEYRPLPDSESRRNARLRRQADNAIDQLKALGMLD